MTKKEVLEIRHQFAQATCSIDKICGCYVDGDRRKIATMKEAFLSLPEEEAFKYFEIFKKNLSGSIYNSVLERDEVAMKAAVDGHYHLISQMLAL